LSRHGKAAGRTVYAVAPQPAAVVAPRRASHRVETDWAPLGTKVSAFVVAAGVLAGAGAAANAMTKQVPASGAAMDLASGPSADIQTVADVHAKTASLKTIRIANPAVEVGNLLQLDKRAAIQAFQQAGKTASDTVESNRKAEEARIAREKADAGKSPHQRQVEGWIREAISILAANGTAIDENSVDEIYLIIQKESGGNPNAVNNWDSNAAKGTPSKGLMQTIDSTFNAHKLPGHDDIFNPVDNIIAGVRYTYDRYGGFAGHPGLASISVGGGYQGY
jgi:soluble lytic murein transglycosylase-like protein